MMQIKYNTNFHDVQRDVYTANVYNIRTVPQGTLK
jgi:hypothetical protein